MTVRLSLPTYQRLWAYEGLGRQHPAVTVPLDWLDDNARTAAENAMFSELAERGLARGHEPIPSLRAVLRAIAAPEEEFYGFFDQQRHGRRDRFSAVAARDDRTAILAILDERELELRPVDPRALADALVDLALPYPARTGPSLSIGTDELDADGHAIAPASGPGDVYEDEPGEHACRFAALLHEPRIAVGQLYAARRDRTGTRQRCAHPLTYLDTRSGRVYTTVVHGSGGDGLIAVPVDQERLAVTLAHRLPDR